ncbi:MAG: hypothetical protein JJE25_02130 [Bacteroidia bacterium]|nr:hypothetical protein [Bacteroidia bacterium]
MKFRTALSCILLVTAYVLISSCKKDKPIYNETPEITFVSVSSTNVSSYDPLTFTILYQDGDGDLGENTDGIHNLFLTDSRFGIPYQYRIKELSPQTPVIIKGTLTITLNNAKLTGSGTEYAVFSIYVVDRAGHTSNSVTSPTITVHQ